ncbi:MAG: hypothetical protein NTY09_08380 [bacterium]|nr:hypothetical protein [bacterium]
MMFKNDQNNGEGVFEPVIVDDPLNPDTETIEEKAEDTQPIPIPVTESEIPETRTFRIKIPTGISPLLWILVVVVFAGIIGGIIGVINLQERANDARARLASGQDLLLDGDSFGALYQFTRAIELNPRLPGAHAALGRIAIENGQAAEAVRKFQEELAVNPDDRESHLALGCLYTLGCISADDPHELRAYINQNFASVLPYNWPADLQYTPDPGTDSLSAAVYNFQFALERLPDDPTPEIGLALNQIANYGLDAARQRLSKLLAGSQDEGAILVAQDLIGDINSEEQFETWLAQNPDIPNLSAGLTEPLVNPADGLIPSPVDMSQQSGLSSELQPLPGFGSGAEFDPGSFTSSETDPGQFGSRPIDPNFIAENAYPPQIETQVTPEDLVPQPTVKPITNDIHIDETNEWVHTVRVANIYQAGSVGFREGETVVMPVTNVEVKVIESSEDKIILEERGYQFTWVPGEVGWTQLVEEQPVDVGSASAGTAEPVVGDLGPDVGSE